MTEFLVWCVFAAIPVLLVVGELRAARKRKREAKKHPNKIENLSILLAYIGAAVVWRMQIGGAL